MLYDVINSISVEQFFTHKHCFIIKYVTNIFILFFGLVCVFGCNLFADRYDGEKERMNLINFVLKTQGITHKCGL